MINLGDINEPEADIDNKLFQYDLDVKNSKKTHLSPVASDPAINNNVIKSRLYPDLEREIFEINSSNNNKQVQDESGSPKPKQTTYESTSQGPSTSSQANKGSLKDKINAIGFNSREVRLVGPENKPVEVKGDMASQVIIAWQNLQKEAATGWDQVRGRLDQGWTDFKKMVDGVIES